MGVIASMYSIVIQVSGVAGEGRWAIASMYSIEGYTELVSSRPLFKS